MRILITLTYFQPYKSGLTVYAVRLADALTKRGHQVTVLTSRYSASLPEREKIGLVEVVRMPIMMRVSKGVIMPTFPFKAWSLIQEADVVNVHVPQLDAATVAVLSRLQGKPVVTTYQCDLRLPKGFINQLANKVSYVADRITVHAAQAIVATSQDYAENSIFLPHFLDKVKVVTAPITLPEVTEEEIHQFRDRLGITPDQKVIGIGARLATEKGVEYLVEAMPLILQKYPTARVLSYGPYQNLIGEEAYAQKLMPLIQALGNHWTFLGVISDRDVASFFHVCDLSVLPSINSTEAFGMVQIESMTCGTPVVASNLPGIRQPIIDTGMGKLIPPRDSQALAEAVISILDNQGSYNFDAKEIKERYSPNSTAMQYENIFKELLSQHGK